MGKLMNHYPQFSYDDALYRLPLGQGWALLNVAVESSPFASAERTCDGYIAQAIKQRS